MEVNNLRLEGTEYKSRIDECQRELKRRHDKGNKRMLNLQSLGNSANAAVKLRRWLDAPQQGTTHTQTRRFLFDRVLQATVENSPEIFLDQLLWSWT